MAALEICRDGTSVRRAALQADTIDVAAPVAAVMTRASRPPTSSRGRSRSRANSDSANCVRGEGAAAPTGSLAIDAYAGRTRKVRQLMSDDTRAPCAFIDALARD
jgi:hypothetical protein